MIFDAISLHTSGVLSLESVRAKIAEHNHDRASANGSSVGLHVEKEAGDVRGARGGELPVGVELGVVDRHIVGVAFNAQIVGRSAQCSRQSAQRGEASGLGRAEPESKKPASRRLMTRPSRPISREMEWLATWLERVWASSRRRRSRSSLT